MEQPRTIRDLGCERATKLAEAREILTKVKDAGRGPTAEEQKEFDQLMLDADKLNVEANEIRLALENGRTPPPRGRIITSNMIGNTPSSILLAKNQRLTDSVSHAERDCDLGKLISLSAGVDVPNCAHERNVLAQSMDSQGGFSVPTMVSSQIIDLARDKSVIFKAGAKTYVMRSQKEIIPKLLEDPEAEWKKENALASESKGAFGATTLNARTLMAWLPISNELLQDALGLGEFLRDALAQVLSTTLDRACLAGNGKGENPLGLFNQPDVRTTAPTSGGAFQYDDLIRSHGRVEGANYTPTAVVCSTGTQTHYRMLKDGEGRYLQPLDWMAPIVATNAVPNTFGNGSQAAFCCGDFTNMVVGMRQNLRVEVLREAAAQRNQTIICAVLRADVGLLRPSAFDIVGPATLA